MDYQETAEQIIAYVGGKENIKSLTHCFTRLRFVLKDESLADKNKKKLEQTQGVISVVSAGGEYQVVCGAKVNPIYDAVIEQLGGEPTEKEVNREIKKEPVKGAGRYQILQLITQMFTPLVPAIAAAGLIKGILTAIKLLMERRGVDISGTDTYVILYAASQVIFYFFPIFLAMTSAKALKCNQVIAMLIGGLLVYPAIDQMVQDVNVKTSFLGLPVVKEAWKIGDSIKVFSYTESVIPIILAVIFLSFLERGLEKIVPDVLKIILIPGVELFVMIPVTLCVLGPVGIYIGNLIQFLYDGLIGISPILGGAMIGGLWGVFVIFGAHRALLPIGLNDVAINGRQNILAFAGAANFAQSGAALGVWLKAKDEDLKQVAASGTLAAGLVGITEPAIYGCNLRLKSPMVCAIASGAVGGAIMGMGRVYGDAFANNGVLTIFTYAAFGMTRFLFYLVGIAAAFFGAAVFTYVVWSPDKEIQEEKTVDAEQNLGDSQIEICAPLEGKAISLSKVTDEVFASGELGQGAAIVPEKGEIVAPADGVVTVIYTTLHAVGMQLDSGVEILIHMGVDTVHLNGKYFTKHVEEGMHITKGTKIVSFDLRRIIQEGYDVTTPVIVANTSDYQKISQVTTGAVTKDMVLLQIKKRRQADE